MNTTESTPSLMFVNGHDTTQDSHDKAPALLFKILQVIIIVVISVGLPGNLLTIISVCHYKRLRTAGNAFVTCMSIVDSLYYGFMLPVRFATFQYDGQFFSDKFCVFLGSFAHFVQGISVMSLSAISLNRLLFIRQHKHYQKIYSRGALVFQLCFIWGFAFFFTILLPCTGLWGEFSFQEHVLACTFTPGADPGYMITVVTIGFWVPTTFIVVCYSMIYVHFMSSHNKVNSWTSDQHKMTTVQPQVKPIAEKKPIKQKLTKIQEEEQTTHLRVYMNKKVNLYSTQSGVFSNGLSNSSCTTSTNSSASPFNKEQEKDWHADSLPLTREERRASNLSNNSGQCLIPELSSQDNSDQDTDKESTKTGQSGITDVKCDSLQRKSSEVLSKSAVSVNILSPSNDTAERHFNMPSRLNVIECRRQDSISSISELLNHEEAVNRFTDPHDDEMTNNGNNDGKVSWLPGNQTAEAYEYSRSAVNTFHTEDNSPKTTRMQVKDTKAVIVSGVPGDSNDEFYAKEANNSFDSDNSTGKGAHNNTIKSQEEVSESQPTYHKSTQKTTDQKNKQRRLSASELLHLRTEVLIQKKRQLAHKEHHQNLNQTVANKRRKEAIRMTLMMLCIFCLFVICILPYFLVNIINKEIENASAYLLALMCTWFNGCVNPVVYAMMNAQFRAAYKSLVSRCPPRGPCGSRDKFRGHQNSDKVRLQLNQSATHI